MFQAEGRPVSAPILGKSNPIKIKVHGDVMGKGMINEVDVLAELVPPPPEFAAPPPHLQSHHTKSVQKLQPNKGQQILASQLKQHAMLQNPVQILNKKEDIRSLNPTQQVHIVHKPTPQSQFQMSGHHQQQPTYMHNNLMAVLDNQKLVRQTNTPPPPPPPEFSDCSAAARLGISDHAHYHPHFKQQMQLNQAQYLQQAAAQQHLIQQVHSEYQMGNSKYATLNRYYGKQNQSMGQPIHNQSGYIAISKTPNPHEFKTAAYSFGNEHLCLSESLPNTIPQGYNYHQFATLTRRKPLQQLSTSMPNYSDYTRLTLQNRLMRQQSQPQQINKQLEAVQHHLQQQQNLSPAEAKMAIQAGLIMPPQPMHPPPPGPPPSLQKGSLNFAKKSIVDWTEQDVSDWLVSIGMIEHQNKFEYINGVKLLRLDTNDLLRIGVAPSQHTMYILEKIKQHLHHQQQYPPN